MQEISPETQPDHRALDPSVLAEIVRRVVETTQPERIILFGSAARGEMGPHSDVDLLIVKAGEYRPRELSYRIRRALRGTGPAFDIIVATSETLQRYGDCFALVYHPALHEERVIYEAA